MKSVAKMKMVLANIGQGCKLLLTFGALRTYVKNRRGSMQYSPVLFFTIRRQPSASIVEREHYSKKPKTI